MSILGGPGTTSLSRALAAVNENSHLYLMRPSLTLPQRLLVISVVETKPSYHRVLKEDNSGRQCIHRTSATFLPETLRPLEHYFPYPAPASTSSACLYQFAYYGLVKSTESDELGGLHTQRISLSMVFS